MDFKQMMKTVKNEASDAVEVTKLKTRISKEKTEIKDMYEKIGEQMYKNYKSTGAAPDEYMDTMGKIDEARARIAQYNTEIEQIKIN